MLLVSDLHLKDLKLNRWYNFEITLPVRDHRYIPTLFFGLRMLNFQACISCDLCLEIAFVVDDDTK